MNGVLIKGALMVLVAHDIVLALKMNKIYSIKNGILVQKIRLKETFRLLC